MTNRPLLLASAALCLGANARAETLPARLAVSLLQSDGATIQLRLRVDQRPALGWAAAASQGPPRMVLTWDSTLALDRPLPVPPPEQIEPLQGLTLHQEAGQAQLELQLSKAVHPTLRRIADSWVLRLEPAAPENVPAAAPGPEVLLVDASVNGQALGSVVRVEQWPGEGPLLPLDAWAEARLAPLAQRRSMSDGTPAYALDALPGAGYALDRRNLSLTINTPPGAFMQATLGPHAVALLPPPRPQPGVVLNYDLSLGYGGAGSRPGGGAMLEAMAFNRFGTFVSSALVRDDGGVRSATRLDTFWRYDMPNRLETLVLGDTVGAGGGWSRPARYAGLRWGRDFGMRPGFVTLPQLTLAGEAALPSTVDVLVNNARRLSERVAPGPFELTNVPVITGAGDINLVVHDLLGRETVVHQSYYASPRLLAPGLTDFSLESGWLRSGYGRDSRYGEPFGAGTLRAGLTTWLTAEGRMELQAQRRAAGVELAGLVGTWAVGRMAFAASSGNPHGVEEHGQVLQLGLERSSPRGGGALQYEYASQGFAPFGEGTGPAAAAQRARERWMASLGGPLWGATSGGISYVRQTRWDGERVEVAGLSLSRPLWQRASISVSLDKRLDGEHDWRGAMNLSVPFDSGIYAGTRMERSTDGQLAGAVSAARSAPAGPGLGWRVEGSSVPSQRARGGLQYNTSQAEWALDVASDAGGQVAARAAGRGSIGLLAGQTFASRPIGQGAFAVVEVDGMPNVPILRSHQVVATTDAGGRAFVPGLLAWQANQIEIDPLELPLDATVGAVAQEVTPYPGSGAVVKFAVRRSRQALVLLQQPGGQPVPLGARVRLLPDGPEFMLGRRGEVWLTDLAGERQPLQVSWPGGGCRLELQVPAADGVPARIGPLACGNAAP